MGHDVSMSAGGYEIAALAAGGSIALTDAALDGHITNGYALTRCVFMCRERLAHVVPVYAVVWRSGNCCKPFSSELNLTDMPHPNLSLVEPS